MLIPKDQWNPAEGLILEDSALKVTKSENNTLVVAGPGAGKTELLAQRASFLLETDTCKEPKKILAISFKKDAAKNLAERVERRCGKELAKRFQSMTYDAFAKSLVDRFYLGIPEEYRPLASYEIAVSNKDQNDIRAAYDYAGYVASPDAKKREVNNFLEKNIVQFGLPLPQDTHTLTKVAWRVLLKGELDGTAKLSFPMLCRLATFLISTNLKLKKALQLTYSHVFLDEFQDTTSLQYEMIKTCFHQSNTVITAVGDSKQRIMVWAGAMVRVFSTFSADFQAERFTLLMNHRSAPRLVEMQKVFFSRFKEQPLTIQTNPRWNHDDGNAYLHLFKDHSQESECVSKIIKNLIENDEHRPEDICVLVKQRVELYSDELINKLEEFNIKARNEGVFQNFLKEEYISLCIDTLLLCFQRNAVAWEHCKNIWLEMNNIDDTSSEIIEWQIKLSDFVKNLKSEINIIHDASTIKAVIDKVTSFYGISKLKEYFPQYLRSNYIQDLQVELSSYLWQEYINTESLKLSLDNLLGKNTVPIMTIHKSKGLEYKTIIFLGLEDAAFFTYHEQPEEDTAAFFVALSRAKENMHFTFCNYRITSSYNNYNFQKRRVISDFYRGLEESGVVEVIDYTIEVQ